LDVLRESWFIGFMQSQRPIQRSRDGEMKCPVARWAAPLEQAYIERVLRAGSERKPQAGRRGLRLFARWTEQTGECVVSGGGDLQAPHLAGVGEQSVGHPFCIRKTDWNHETGFRYVFHHPGDKNRELTLTVLVFDVPEAP